MGGMLFWAGLGATLYLVLESGQFGLQLGFAGVEVSSVLLAAARAAYVLRFVLTKLEVMTHSRPRRRHLEQLSDEFWAASHRSCAS